MFRILIYALAVFALGLLPGRGQTVPPNLAWNPAQTLVLVVGVLKWQDSDEFGSFPDKNRRDQELVAFFRKAGVPAGNLIYLQDQAATLAAIQGSLNRLLQESRPGQTLMVYYAGHGYSDEAENSPVFFANYDAGVGKVGGWSVRQMVNRIDEGFQGDRVVLMADCCQSGALIQAAKQKGRRLPYACFASSLRNESSTGNWTYTEALLAAWKGEGPVDADRDGVITVKEMQNYLHSEMAFAEEQKSASAVTGLWKSTDVLAAARPLVSPREGEHVEVYAEEDWWMARIEDQKDGKFKVFYYGYEKEDSEWVGAKRLRIPAGKISQISSQLGIEVK